MKGDDIPFVQKKLGENCVRSLAAKNEYMSSTERP